MTVAERSDVENYLIERTAHLNAESQQFRQEFEKEKYYPVITIGVGYRF